MDDDTDHEDAGYPPEPRHLKPRHALFSSTRPDPPRIGRHSADLARDDEEQQQKRKQNYADRPSDDDEDDDVGGRDGDSSGEDVDSSSENREKRRRIEKFDLGFELAPHVPAPPVAPSKPPARILPTEWSEESTFVLLDSWGDRYMQNGRKSLRPDQWSEVHKKVLQSSRVHRTDSQCRNRIDTLKKKYRKEKAILTADGKSGSKWVYFKQMDALMSLPSSPLLSSGKQPLLLPPPQPKLPYGVDAGANVFSSSYVHRDSCDGNSAMRDCVSEDDSDVFPPKRENLSWSSDSSFRMLAESIRKFGEIFEKMESNKRQQMSEIERMRKEFQRDLEVQKRQILERAQLEIAKLSEEHGDGNDEEQEDNDDDDTGGSAENLSGFISASLYLTAFV